MPKTVVQQIQNCLALVRSERGKAGFPPRLLCAALEVDIPLRAEKIAELMLQIESVKPKPYAEQFFPQDFDLPAKRA